MSCELNTFDINDDNFNDIIMDMLENPKNQKPLFLNMLLGECTLGDCPGWVSAIHKVAKIAQR